MAKKDLSIFYINKNETPDHLNGIISPTINFPM